MDAMEKKLFAQFDDDAPGVRQNALEALREHLLKAGRTFRDIVADIEKAISPAKAAELEKKLAEFIEANAEAQKRDAEWQKRDADRQREIDKLTREISRLKAALWIKIHWKISGAVAAGLLVLVAGAWAYDRYWSRSEAVNAGLRAAVASASWGEGWSEPLAGKIGGQPYWLMFRGDIDAASYSDNHGNTVEMRCLHLFASPAQPDSGQYFKPSPRNFLGWVSWPEVAMQCKPSPNQRADTETSPQQYAPNDKRAFDRLIEKAR